MVRWRRRGLLSLTLAACALGTSDALAATLVPCTPTGNARYNCEFHPPGDGINAGSPVLASDGTTIGFLRQGTNFVICQRLGSPVHLDRFVNSYWAFTQADNGRFGWVNAVYARGGDNRASFGGGVPRRCAPPIGEPPKDDGKFVTAINYILGEIQKNSDSEILKKIAGLNRKYEKTGKLRYRLKALALFGAMEAPGRPWDHQPALKRMFKLEGRGQDALYWDVPGTDKRLFYDIWSNIHYGYVGRVARFAKKTLRAAHNFPGTGKHSPDDDMTVEMGLDLYDRYKDPGKLTAEAIRSMVIGRLGALQESVRPRRPLAPSTSTAPTTAPTPVAKYYVDTFAEAIGFLSARCGQDAPSEKRCRPQGKLLVGTHYVLCKVRGERIGSAKQFNHWWLLTDLDVLFFSGAKRRAYVSAYYLKRWGNDEARDNMGRAIPNC